MTRLEAVDLVKNLLFEDAATTGLATTAQFNTVVDLSNKAVWNKAVSLCPSMFTTTSADLTYVAATGYYDLPVATYYLPTRVDIKYGENWYPLDPAAPQDSATLDSTTVQPAGVAPLAYWMDGTKMRFLPRPSQDQTFRIVSVAPVATLAADGTALLAGMLPEYHTLVPYEAAMLLAAKDEASAQFQSIKLVRDELYKTMTRHLSRRSAYRSHSIRDIPFA